MNILSNKEYATYAYKKLSCAINNILKERKIPLSRRLVRAEVDKYGLWAPRKRGYLYALDVVILGKKADYDQYWYVSNFLGLPNSSLSKSIDDGFTQRSFLYTCEYDNELSSAMYDVGTQLFIRFKNDIGSN